MTRLARFRLRTLSVTTRTAILLSALIGAIFVVAGLLAFRDADSRALDRGLGTLDHYARHIAEQQEQRFERIRTVHARATELLRAELRHDPAIRNAAAFDAMFPRDPRGGRRSAPALFDGGTTPFGYVRGVGAFVPGEPDAATRALLMAATRIVHGVGEGVSPELESLYLFTPRNDLVMFAPDRPDRLAFYRKDAPPDLDFQSLEFAAIVTPAANRDRTMRCTALRHILSDTSGGTWTTGCMTPIDIDGRHVGAWGTSVLLDQLLEKSDFEDLPNANVILISREGRLIHHPAHTHQSRAGPESLLDLTQSRDPGLQALWRFVQSTGDRPFLGEAPELDAFVALRRIDATGWTVLVTQDPAIMHAESTRTIYRIVLTALACLILQALAIFLLLRAQVGRPLHRLIDRTRALARRTASAHLNARAPVETGDEVTLLTHDFDMLAERVTSAQAQLERKVADRTQRFRRANQALRLAIARDPLTGVSHRRHVVAEIDGQLASDGPDGQVLLAIDIDRFDAINRRHGTDTGDQVLIQVANAIPALLREGDLFGRSGGGEFVALVRVECLADAMNIAERIRFGVASLDLPARHGETLRASISIGVAAARDGDGFDSLYARADAALAQAKTLGRDRIAAHDPATTPNPTPPQPPPPPRAPRHPARIGRAAFSTTS